MIEYSNDLRLKILTYYQAYYKNLGLPNHKQHAVDRLEEDEWELKRLIRLENRLAVNLKNYKRHLIIGLGTGGLLVALKSLGIKEVYGIEPYGPALEIAEHKASSIGLPKGVLQKAVAEDLPYTSGTMDFIHCFSVLEHVKSVRQSIREMYRVITQKGMIYIHTVNYSWPYEGHYKVPAPVFLPGGKMLTKFWLRILGRPTEYLQSLNFFSERDLNRILKKEVFLFHRIFSKDLKARRTPGGKSMKSRLARIVLHFFYQTLDINPYQEIIIKKNAD